MDYRKFGNTYVIRMDRGEEIVRTLTDFCKKENVTLGSVDALGAADHAVIGLYDVETREFHKKTFDEPLEISSLHGNISTMNGEIYLRPGHLLGGSCPQGSQGSGTEARHRRTSGHDSQPPGSVRQTKPRETCRNAVFLTQVCRV